MTSNNWKKVEYKVAKILGGKRVPVSGITRGFKEDVEHKEYFIEVKTGKQIPKQVLKWYEEFKKCDICVTLGYIKIAKKSIPKRILDWWEKTKAECPENKKPLLVMKPRYCHFEFVLFENELTNDFIFTTLEIFAYYQKLFKNIMEGGDV